MKKKIMVCAIVLLVLAAGSVGAFYLNRALNYTCVGGSMIHNKTEYLDLSGQPLEDPQPLYRLQDLKLLDLEGTGITVQEYEALQEALPECRILWLVPFQGAYYPQDTQELTITSLTAEEIETLDHLPRLKTVNAAGCTDYDALLALQSRRPDCAVHYTVAVEGRMLPEDTVSLSVSAQSVEELRRIMALLPKLESIRVTGCRDALGLLALQSENPQCAITYDVYIGDTPYSSASQQLTLDTGYLHQLTQVFPCFSQVTDVILEGSGSSPELHALADAYPHIRFHYSFELLGVSVHTDQTFVDLSGIKMEDTQALEAALPYFHQLTQVDMVDCGIANEDMAALNDRHQQTLFVWTVTIAEEVFRTDIKAFYPRGKWLYVTDDTIKNLKYCTELVALDLGHYEVTDCSFLYNMPHLQYLVLADCKISDLTPIGSLKELRFLELFMTKGRDYWSLVNCTSLEDLNLCYAGYGDITPLLQMPWLRRVWIIGNYTSEEEKQLLATYLPNTVIFYDGYSSTGNGWRYGDNYYRMRNALGAYYMD